MLQGSDIDNLKPIKVWEELEKPLIKKRWMENKKKQQQKQKNAFLTQNKKFQSFINLDSN